MDSKDTTGIGPKQIYALKVFAQARKMANDGCLVEAYEIWEYHKSLAWNEGDDELLVCLREQEARFDTKFLHS